MTHFLDHVTYSPLTHNQCYLFSSPVGMGGIAWTDCIRREISRHRAQLGGAGQGPASATIEGKQPDVLLCEEYEFTFDSYILRVVLVIIMEFHWFIGHVL